MTEIQDRYAAIAAGFAERLAAAPADTWSSPSPCSEWTAGDVAAHVVRTHRNVLSMLDGSDAPAVGADDDVMAEWEQATGAMTAALADPAIATRTINSRFGDMTFQDMVGRMVCADTLIHTWDLARATGGNEELDPDSVTHVVGFLSAAGDRLRGPGGFGPALEPPAGADDVATLMSFAGRTV